MNTRRLTNYGLLNTARNHKNRYCKKQSRNQSIKVAIDCKNYNNYSTKIMSNYPNPLKYAYCVWLCHIYKISSEELDTLQECIVQAEIKNKFI